MTTYWVNALGQRVRKSSSAGSTLFAYDESGHLLGEYSGTGALIQETVWLGETPVATLRPAAGSGIDIYYVHSDHLNTPRRVTRASDNALVWRWTSDPYGVGFVDQDPAGTGTLFTYHLRFPGQYYDTETARNYNMARDYNPALGRYVESDPVGLKAGINTCSYANGSPVLNADRSGLLALSLETYWHMNATFNDRIHAGYTAADGPLRAQRIDGSGCSSCRILADLQECRADSDRGARIR